MFLKLRFLGERGWPAPKSLDVVAAAIHFDLVFLAGDRSQRLRNHRGPVPLLPLLSMQHLNPEEVGVTTSTEKAKLHPVHVDLQAWLATRARVLVLEETYRFGSSVADLVRALLPAHGASLKVARGSEVDTEVKLAELVACWRALPLDRTCGSVT